MTTGFRIILVLLCVNLSCGILYELGLCGVEYAYPSTEVTDLEDMIEDYDPADFINQTDPSVFTDLPYLGYIAPTFSLWNVITSLVNGFPRLLNGLGQMIPDAEARAAFDIIADALVVLNGLVIGAWFMQTILGRRIQD